MTVGRKWNYKGRQHSHLNAECADGHFVNPFEAAYGEGVSLSGALVNSCRSKG